MSRLSRLPGALVSRLDAAERAYAFLDARFLPLDKRAVARTRNLRLVPALDARRGGKRAYGEWCHVIGLFQSLIAQVADRRPSIDVLDVGCGTGLLAVACEPFVQDGGRYVGMDVNNEWLDLARANFTEPWFEFSHLAVHNAMYAPDASGSPAAWPLDDAEFDLVTALSVWTHFNEDDAVRYLRETARVLRPGGTAIVTAFVLDDDYGTLAADPRPHRSRFHRRRLGSFVFTEPVDGSTHWRTVPSVQVAENRIGFDQTGLDHLLETSGLILVDHHRGSWKEVPGLFHQDVLVLGRPD